MTLTSRLIEGLVAPLWALHERSPYLRICRQLDREKTLSLEERSERQWKLLTAMISKAWQQSPFYRERFQSVGFEPGDLRNWKDLQALPLLKKVDIVKNSDRILANSMSRDSLHSRKTSGSTGVSLRFHLDEQCTQWHRAVTLYRDQWTGWRLGEYRAMIWGNPEHVKTLRGRLRNLLLERTFYLDTLKMNTRMMEQFAAQILRKRPTLIFGHAHSLYLFAQYWQSNNYPSFQPKGLLSTAMALHQHERDGIARVFGNRIFDRYGCEEVSLIASECEAHQGLHINTDGLVVEVIKNATSAEPGEEGEVVVTDLFNRGMPFIRYQVGDMAVLSPKSCSCGRSYPLLATVAGRIADYLVTPQGEYISGISLTENFATLIPDLYQAQIIQTKKDEIQIKVVPRETFSNDSMTQIATLVRERFGNQMRFEVTIVANIPPEPSGKYRFAISHLTESSSIGGQEEKRNH